MQIIFTKTKWNITNMKSFTTTGHVHASWTTAIGTIIATTT